MNMIAAVDRNWAIGLNGKLLVSIPEDKKFFKRMTTGNIVIMGRKTLESLPGGNPLKGRVNIVLTSNMDYNVEDVQVIHSVSKLLEVIKEYDNDSVFVIGGGTVYRQLIPYCDTAYITFIDYQFEVDSFIENLDNECGWRMDFQSDKQIYFDLEYYFRRYRRI